MASVPRFCFSVFGFLVVLSLTFTIQSSFAQTANHLVISEIQIGGASSTSDEFVEIYNPTNAAIDLSTLPLKLHIRNSAGTDVNKTLTFIRETIPSQGWFLIGSSSYSLGISFDATYSAALVSNGGIYISTSATANVGIIDMVGWGTQPSGGYEVAACPNIPVNQSIERKPGGGLGNYIDTDNNSLDFLAATTVITPRNSMDTPLPVELILFSVSGHKLSADLQWSTATETNNHGFDIERRSVQSDNWLKVGFVAGAGTSSSPRNYSYVDARLFAGRYAYRIKQIDNDGTFKYYGAAEVEIGLAAKEFRLESNYPNPFNPSTAIQYTLAKDGRASLKVFNMLGQEVSTLFDGEAEGGRIYLMKFDASKLPSGVYFYLLQAKDMVLTKKMLLLK